MFPILFRIGPITLHTYGLMVAIGFLLGFVVAKREFDRRGLPTEMVDQAVLLLMLSGLFGARFTYFLLTEPGFTIADPFALLRIWEGGLVYYGGFILAFVALGVYSRIREVSFIRMLDALIPPLFLAHAVGRLGCFSAGCCYGKPTESFLGVTFHHPESLAPTFVSLHPTQLYSFVGILILFFWARALCKMNLPDGFLFAFYLSGYGLFRFLIEFLRDDFRGHVAGNLYPSQWIAIGAIISSAILFRYVKRTTQKK